MAPTNQDVTGQPTPAPDMNNPQPALTDQASPSPSQQNPASVFPSATQAQPQPNQPNNNNGEPTGQVTNTPDQPHPMSKIFNGILKTMSGGPIKVVDPATGAIREVPQTKGQMGRAIVAAALAGLMTPTQYRNTPYGPVADPGNTQAAAMQAGADFQQKRQAQAQQLTNDQQAAKLFTIQNNAKLVQQAAAMAHQKHEVLQDTVQRNQDVFMKPLLDFDKNRPADMPDSIFLNKGMTSQQVFDSGHSLTDNNVIMDGFTTKPNPQTGVLEDEPTYAVVNNKANLKLPKDVTDELGKFNKSYAKAFDLTGGNVIVPINAYMDAVHTANTLSSVEAFMNRAQKEIDPKAKGNIDLAAAYKANPVSMQTAIDTAEKTLAAGHGRPDDGTTDNVIRAIRASQNGDKLLGLLGDPATIDKWAEDQQNKRESDRALAKLGGVGDKAPVSPAQQSVLKSAISQLPDADDRNALLSMIPPDRPLTTGEAEKIGNELRQTIQQNKSQAIQKGDPVVLQKQANDIVEGDLSSVKDLMNARSGVRTAFNTMLQDEARKRGLDPTKYTLESQQAKADMYKDFSGTTTKTGAQLLSFNTLMGHVAEAVDANDNWIRSGSPLINRPISWLAENAANDQDYKRFQNAIIAPAKEYMNFLNQNRAEHESDIKALEAVLDPNATPASAMTALKSFATTSDIRAANFGRKYIQTVGTTFPNLITPMAADTLKRLGIASQAAPLSVVLPRGWQNNQATKLTDLELAKKFAAAAGNNKQATIELMKANGWMF